MAELSKAVSEGKDEKVSRVNSFTKFLRSPARPKSMRKSHSNPFSKLLFRRKSSKEGNKTDEGDDGSSFGDGHGIDDIDADFNTPTVIEEVKEVVETVADNNNNALHHHHNQQHSSAEQTNDDAISTKPKDVPSTDVEESKEKNKPSLLEKFKEEVQVVEHSGDHLGDKLKHGLLKAKSSMKEDFDKAKEGLESILHIDHHHHHKKPSIVVDDDIIVSDDNQKHQQQQQHQNQHHAVVVDQSSAEVVKAPQRVQQQEEQVVDVGNTIKDGPKSTDNKGVTGHEEEIKVVKKEDGCVTSLAQGLEKMCAPWSSKKKEE